MRFYLNPCFTRYSFESTDKRRMPQKNHNFNQSCERSSDSSSSTDEHKLNNITVNHAQFDIDETYRPEDSLTMEFRGHTSKDQKERKKKHLIIYCVIAAVLLLILLAVISFVVVHFVKRDETKSNNDTSIKTEASTKDNEVDSSKGNKEKNVNKSDSDGVCNTERCKFIAENLKRSMNFSVDPCDNFHEYSCGIWDQTHPLPASMPKLDTMALLNLQKNTYLKNIIEAESQKAKQAKGFKSKILKFYKSCQNLELIDKRGKSPLLKFISKFGKWSPINSWTQAGENSLDISSLIILSHQYFTLSVYDDRVNSPLFKAIVKVNDVNSSQHILELNLPDLPIADQTIYITKDARSEALRTKYKLLQTNYVALLGPSSDAEEKLKQLMDFEIELANITLESSFIRNVMQQYNLTTIKKFQKYVGTEINWLQVLKGFFSPLGIEMTEDTNIGIRSIDFFKALNDFISRTPNQLVKDYIIWVCVWKFGSYVSGPFREADYNFQRAVMGIQERPERWKKCITDIEQTMEFGLASLYVEKALTDEDKGLATEIVANITREFKKNLVNVEWMDVSTKAKAFEKVDSIAKNIGYPQYVKNETYLNRKYKNVHVHRRYYFENTLKMYQQKRISNLKLLNEAVDRTNYDLPPTLVEAYFDPNKNKMVFLAGILHVPFYDTKGPMALNYGALGLVVGHEVTHAFDDLGRQFDGNGEKKNWWTDESSKAFYRRSDCIMDQYSNYSMYGINVDGRLTLGENIADNGGIKVAYLAYKEWERTHGKEKKLPGIPLTMDQLLFVSHGQVWCGAYREEYIKRALKIDYHSPAKYRIIGPLSNLKSFSDAFNCPVGSTMNPVKKCRVW